ncbi:NTP transferase domain-containing protein [Coprothermobacteraceae bacterium]|nr:NTP transferase domain-containing protein [Coprothermobacteraceae bacterium]
MSQIKYVIVQAGGKGTRMGKYTINKPKALVSIEGRPLILHAMQAFPEARFVIVGDYKYEVLRDYLRTYADKRYVLVKASGTGTCAGLREALSYVPRKEPFVLTWSDLWFPNGWSLGELDLTQNYVGISANFTCRWSFDGEQFLEEPSADRGVAGFFVFRDKSLIEDVPSEGEFVRYLSNKPSQFKALVLHDVKEFGRASEYEEYLERMPSARPFNKLEYGANSVKKVPQDQQGLKLAKYESQWYRVVSSLGYSNIPTVTAYAPLELQMIEGRHPFELEPTARILEQILVALKGLHELSGSIPSDRMSLEREYYIKTYERLMEVRSLIPFACRKDLIVNGTVVPNPFNVEQELADLVRSYYPSEFSLIHGDPTFSNTLVDGFGRTYLIDPRGYFGYTELYGDPDYDFAKVYYSMMGNYDQFNRKKFDLRVHEAGGDISIMSNGYERYEEAFWDFVGHDKKEKIRALHAVIWLSLAAYAWDDYDMILGAFLRGAALLREVL